MKADKQGREYVKIDKVVDGQTVWLDGGFTCSEPGPVKLCVCAAEGAWFECGEGRHFLDGQVDDEEGSCIGVYVAEPGVNA